MAVFGPRWVEPLKKGLAVVGFVGFVAPPPVQARVFTTFSQPAPVRAVPAFLQSQPSFEVARVILAVTPGPFTPFEQPRSFRPQQPDAVSFEIAPPVAAATAVAFSGFAEFAVSRLKSVPDGFKNAPFAPPVAAVVVNFSGFADFGTPQQAKRTASDFSNAPFAGSVQSYVFGQFSQPAFSKPPLPVDPLFAIGSFGPGRLVFGQFDIPARASFRPDGFTNAPQPAIVQSVVYTAQFADFGSARSYQVQQGEWVRFVVAAPTAPVVIVSFTGFADFGSTAPRTAQGWLQDFIANTPQQPPVGVSVPLIGYDVVKGSGHILRRVKRKWLDDAERDLLDDVAAAFAAVESPPPVIARIVAIEPPVSAVAVTKVYVPPVVDDEDEIILMLLTE